MPKVKYYYDSESLSFKKIKKSKRDAVSYTHLRAPRDKRQSRMPSSA